jgi:hypothetical protein
VHKKEWDHDEPEQNFVAGRLDEATLARVDVLVTQLSKDRPVTQSDVLRTLLRLALDEVQKEPGLLAEPHRAKR